jgi:hypothetical protein
MAKLRKIFLVIALTTFSVGFTEAGSEIGWGILKPLGAVSFILFFITNLLAKEFAAYDAEQHLRMTLAAQNSMMTSSKPAKSFSTQQREPVFASAAARNC